MLGCFSISRMTLKPEKIRVLGDAWSWTPNAENRLLPTLLGWLVFEVIMLYQGMMKIGPFFLFSAPRIMHGWSSSRIGSSWKSWFSCSECNTIDLIKLKTFARPGNQCIGYYRFITVRNWMVILIWEDPIMIEQFLPETQGWDVRRNIDACVKCQELNNSNQR